MWRRVPMWAWLVGVSVCVIYTLPLEGAEFDYGDFMNSFIIKVDEKVNVEEVAREHGFTVREKLPNLDIYHLTHSSVATRSKRADENFVSRMKKDPRVRLFEQQKVLHREKRTHKVLHDKQLDFKIADIKDNSQYYRNKQAIDTRGEVPMFDDEFFNDQWYLRNVNQTGGKRDIDCNVMPAWKMGYSGKGVVVSILDDGVDHEHEDLKRNYDPLASADFNDADDAENDPTPDKSTSENSHGTRCAGEIAGEAGNGKCGVGIAYDTKIGGIRILDGPVTDKLEAQALMYQKDHIDIKSASWGPHDDGMTMEGPSSACTEALKQAVLTGRNNKGTVFVWATGNGGGYGDNCGADGYVSGIESISVQSMSPQGELPFFGEICTSTMIAVPTGGEKTQEEELNSMLTIKVVTTDINNGCVENFEGTSSAAPLAAGCLALVLQANPDLTWRDVQHIVAQGARVPGPDNMWIINGAGFHVNPQFGFGMIDCTRMVQLAQNWVNKPPQHVCQTQTNTINVDIQSSGCHKFQFDFDGCHGDEASSVTHIEHVQLHVKLQPVRRGNIQIIITSPSGTRSEVLRPRRKDDSNEEIDFDFMTVHKWGEDPAGQWTLEVCDQPPETTEAGQDTTKPAAHFESWSMRVSGYHDDSKPGKPRGRAEIPSAAKLDKIVKKEFLESRNLMLKRAQVSNNHNHNTDQAADGDDEEENIDTFVDTLDSLFATFKRTYGVRSLAKYVEEYINDNDDDNLKQHIHNFPGDKREFLAKKDEGLDELGQDTGLKGEMVDILRDLDSSKMSTGETYLESYVRRKKQMRIQREIDELMRELEDVLEEV